MEKVPTHLSIILDGNGRWATQRGLPRTEGHRQGLKTLEKTARLVRQRGIKYFSVFAFSTENWGRPESEVHFLMELFRYYFNQPRQKNDGVRVVFLGERDGFSKDILDKMDKLEEETKEYSDFYMIICFGYGGKQEITHATREIAREVKEGKLSPDDITMETVQNHLWSAKANIPPVDLMIRTGGNVRVSNFLLWQLAYAEMVFTPIWWPDFSEENLDEILENFSSRERRFGKLNNTKAKDLKNE